MQAKLRDWDRRCHAALGDFAGGRLGLILTEECPAAKEAPLPDSALQQCVGTHLFAPVCYAVAHAQQASSASARLQWLLAAFDEFQKGHTEQREGNRFAKPHERRGSSRLPLIGWDTAVLVMLIGKIQRAAKEEDAIEEEGLGHIVRNWRKLFLFLQSADERYPNDVARRRGGLAVLNGLLSILLQHANTHQCRTVVQIVETAEAAANGDPRKGVLGPCGHMKSEVTKYLYFAARIKLFDGSFADAFRGLCKAFGQLPPIDKCVGAVRDNKLRVAYYWLVAAALTGQRPPDEVLAVDGLLRAMFSPLFEALALGSDTLFDRALSFYAPVHTLRGAFLLLSQARDLCALTVVRRTCAALDAAGQDRALVPLDAVVAAQEHVNTTHVTLKGARSAKRPRDEDAAFLEAAGVALSPRDALGLRIAKLITRGALRGYVSLEHATLVLSKKEPFPSLCV